MRMMKVNYLFLVLALAGLNGFAQQDPIYSQYMFNPFAINPAYAGTRNSMSGVILHRSQWVGIDGAPTTQTATLHAPVNKHKIAWGVNFAHDRIGPTSSTQAGLTGAYHLKFKESKLSFGLRAGIINSKLDRSSLNFKEDNDVYDVGGVVSALVPTVDFGIYYYKTKFFAGLSLTHLVNANFAYEGFPAETNMYLRTHAMLNAGYVFEISPKFVFKPSILIKQVEGVRPNVDLNLSALFYKRFWLGLSFRNKSSVNFLLDVNVTDYLRVGYAYDLLTNPLGQYSKGTHEVFVGFDFDLKKSQTISPRYL
jgi:type IX secretion system PorP/SprF family membrane protein